MPTTNLPRDIAYALFDFDGVIADTNPLYLELDRMALRHFGYDPTDNELRSLMGHPSEVAGPELLAAHGIHITSEGYLGIWDSDRDIYDSPTLIPSPGLHELWDSLVVRNIKIAVVSTTRCVSLVRALNHFRLLSHVDAIVGREMVTHYKPHAEPYLCGLGLLATGDDDAAVRAIAVDDSQAGVTSARAAGIYTICYQGSAETQSVSGANWTVNSFAQITESL